MNEIWFFPILLIVVVVLLLIVYFIYQKTKKKCFRLDNHNINQIHTITNINKINIEKEFPYDLKQKVNEITISKVIHSIPNAFRTNRFDDSIKQCLEKGSGLKVENGEENLSMNKVNESICNDSKINNIENKGLVLNSLQKINKKKYSLFRKYSMVVKK